jgi:hypothetical protein
MAQSQILYGLGSPDFTTLGGKFIYVEPMEFAITGEGGVKESKKFVNGKLVTAGSVLDGETFKLKVGIQAASWTALQFAFGELAGVTSSVSLPEVRYARVPLVAPFEIADPDFATSAGVWVFQVDPIDKALVLSVGVPAVGAFQVNTAGSKIVLNASQAGASVAYRVFKTYTNIASIGVEERAAGDILDQFSFSGFCYADTKRYKIVIPKMGRISVPSLNISDVTKLEVEYQLAVVSGKQKSFELYDI